MDPTVELIALMQQSLQKNATMIAYINSRSSPYQPQTQLLSYQFKPQRPPFPKWYGTLQTTPLLLEQIKMYKAEPFTPAFKIGPKRHKRPDGSAYQSARTCWRRLRHESH